MPELVANGGANISIVRHQAGCAVLIAQVRARWPLAPAGLPVVPGAVPFAKWADRGAKTAVS